MAREGGHRGLFGARKGVTSSEDSEDAEACPGGAGEMPKKSKGRRSIRPFHLQFLEELSSNADLGVFR